MHNEFWMRRPCHGSPYVSNGRSAHAVAQDISLRCDPIVREEGIYEEGWEIFSQLVNHVQERQGGSAREKKDPNTRLLKRAVFWGRRQCADNFVYL